MLFVSPHIEAVAEDGMPKVIARAPLPAGRVVEQCRVISVLGENIRSAEIRKASLLSSVVADGCDRVLSMGYGPMYGESHEGNIEFHGEPGNTDSIFVVTKTDVGPGEELTTDPRKSIHGAMSLEDTSYYRSSSIYAGRCKLGYGIFASSDIPANTIIEESFLLYGHMDALGDEIMRDYVYSRDQSLNGPCAFSLGFGGMFNHSSKPNVSCSRDHKTRKMIFYTLGDVQAGQQLCISYGDTWFSDRDLEVQEVS